MMFENGVDDIKIRNMNNFNSHFQSNMIIEEGKEEDEEDDAENEEYVFWC